jgi:hypothetical protein
MKFLRRIKKEKKKERKREKKEEEKMQNQEIMQYLKVDRSTLNTKQSN